MSGARGAMPTTSLPLPVSLPFSMAAKEPLLALNHSSPHCRVPCTSKLMLGQLKQRREVPKDKMIVASSLDTLGLRLMGHPTRSR